MANDKTIIAGDLEVEGQSNSPFYTITFSTSIALDFNNGRCQKVTLTDDTTFTTPVNMSDGAEYVLMIVQDAAANYTASWSSTYFRFQDAQDNNQWPPLKAVNGAIAIVKMVCENSKLYCTMENNMQAYEPV